SGFVLYKKTMAAPVAVADCQNGRIVSPYILINEIASVAGDTGGFGQIRFGDNADRNKHDVGGHTFTVGKQDALNMALMPGFETLYRRAQTHIYAGASMLVMQES